MSTDTQLTDAELVRLCAEKVMGWHPLGGHLKRWYGDGRELAQAVIAEWNPLTNDTDSCALLDKMAEMNLNPYIRAGDGYWIAQWYSDADAAYRFHTEKELGRTADARRRAIVLAALRAVGVEV